MRLGVWSAYAHVVCMSAGNLPHGSRRQRGVGWPQPAPICRMVARSCSSGALCLLAIWSIVIMPTSAEEARSLSLSNVIDIALRDNKDLQAARYAVDVGHARLLQAGLLPNPRLELSGRNDFAFRNEGEYGNSVAISQQFPIAGRILRQKDVARVDVALAQAEVDEAGRQLAGAVAANVYRLLVIEQQIQSRKQLIGVEDQLAKVTSDRLQAAEVSELDVNTVKLDLQRLSQERDLLESERQSLLVSLNTLIGRSAVASLSINEPLPQTDVLPRQAQFQAQALQNRPDLRGALLSADRARAEQALAKAQRWEDWNLSLGLEQDRVSIEGVPRQSADRAIGLSLSIPLPLFNSNQGTVAEAAANADQAMAHIDAMRLGIAGEVASAYAQATSLQQLVERYRKGLLPVSARNVQLAQKGYGAGQVSVIEVVQAQRQQAELNAAYLNTLDELLQALVRLHTASADYGFPASSGATIDNDIVNDKEH
jgi:outer membrane protein, heavy metal efflux system